MRAIAGRQTQWTDSWKDGTQARKKKQFELHPRISAWNPRRMWLSTKHKNQFSMNGPDEMPRKVIIFSNSHGDVHSKLYSPCSSWNPIQWRFVRDSWMVLSENRVPGWISQLNLLHVFVGITYVQINPNHGWFFCLLPAEFSSLEVYGRHGPDLSSQCHRFVVTKSTTSIQNPL